MNFIKTNLLKKTILLCITNIALFAEPSGFYAEIGGGLGLEDTQKTESLTFVYDQGYFASLALGYQLDLFKFEFEEIYKSDKLHSVSTDGKYSVPIDGELTMNSQMFNTYYSGYNRESKLFSTIGLGMGISTIDAASTTKDSGIFSAQAMLSVGYPVYENLILSTKYRYFYTLKSDNFKAKSDSLVSLSLRYHF